MLCPGLPDGQLLRMMGELIVDSMSHFLKETAGTAELKL